MGQDLIIHWDYQKLIKRLKLAWKTKDILVPYSYRDMGFIKSECKFSPLDGCLENIQFTLNGDGPIFLLDWQTLRVASKAIQSFEWGGVGSIVNLSGLRLKVVDECRNDYLVMLPNIGSVILYYLFPNLRWFDMIYRRGILTAAVWGLADCPAAEIPYWGHLKWFQGATDE